MRAVAGKTRFTNGLFQTRTERRIWQLCTSPRGDKQERKKKKKKKKNNISIYTHRRPRRTEQPAQNQSCYTRRCEWALCFVDFWFLRFRSYSVTMKMFTALKLFLLALVLCKLLKFFLCLNFYRFY